MPVETPNGKNAAEIFTRRIAGTPYIALFNYNQSPKKYSINLKRIGLKEGKAIAEDLLSHRKFQVQSDFDIELPGADATIIKLTTEQN